MDLLEIKPIPGVDFYCGDFTSDDALEWLNSQLTAHASRAATHDQNNIADVILSDMAPNTVGHQKTDHLRQMVLLEYAFDFARRALKPGGTFVAKSFTGGTTNELLRQIKDNFESVHHIKPPSSRKDSVEMFIVAMGFRGDKH
jgi:23S rRNA (uridine2552-2'-O)-methyltransferase